MFLNERRNSLLGEILHRNSWVRIEDLAQQFHVSNRTVRYDLDAIDDFLRANHLPKLLRKQNSGVRFSGNQEVTEKTVQLLNNIGLSRYVLSANERVRHILAELFCAKDYLTIGYLADQLWVSRGTVIKDLQRVRDWLAIRQLELRSITKYGIKLVGNERDIRQAILQLFREHMPVNELVKWFSLEQQAWSDYNFIARWFENVDISFLQKCVRQLEHELQVVFSDIAFTGLIVYLVVAIRRIKAGRDAVIGQAELEALEKSHAFAVALVIAGQVAEEFQLGVPLDEVGLFTEHILGSSVASSADIEREIHTELNTLVCALIASVGRELSCDLSKDRKLYQGLVEEIRPSLYRAKYRLDVENPFLEEIKETYSHLYEVVKKSCKSLDKYIGGQLLEDEVGYLTIHFSAAMERMKAKDFHRAAILVVCAAGLGTANLLSSRLQSIFDVEIIGTVPSHQVQQLLKTKQVDLIVSTVPLPPQDTPCLIVNPLLHATDIALLKNHIDTVKRPDTTIDDLLKVVEKYCEISDRQQLRRQMEITLNKTSADLGEAKSLPSLGQLLPTANIKLNAAASTWQEAIRQANAVLCQQGYVEEKYGQAMIDVMEEMGPYIVFWKGIALPHAGIDCGVKQAAISFVRLKTPVVFGSVENDPVDMIFALAAVDNSTHVMALLELTNILSDPEKVRQLRSESDPRQISRMLCLWSDSRTAIV